jgi:hypothetical protein
LLVIYQFITAIVMSGTGKHNIVYENESKASFETNTIYKIYILPYTALHNHSKLKK